jgi:flagella basal body P-ring formation protein FlgA
MKTETTTNRRPYTKCIRLLAVLPALLALGYSCVATAAVTRSEELIGAGEAFLEQAVSDYLQRSNISGRHEVQINRLDPRLRLPLCPEPLLTTLESPAEPIGRVTLRVRCNASTPWTVFVPAQVRLYREVVIANRPLKRDNVVSDMDYSIRAI